MKRFIFFLSFLSVLFFAWQTQAETDKLAVREADPVSLRENISVSSNYIRLGDFFANVPLDKADTKVAYAPKPGRRASFDARWLYRIARAYGLQWRPLSADLRTVVNRESAIIEKDEIRDAITRALSRYDLPSNPEVELSNKNLRVHVPSDLMAEVQVNDVSYSRRTNRFAAMLSIGEKGMNPVQQIRVTGEVHSMLEIPTLAHRLSKGDVISQNDITWIKVRADQTQRDIVIDAQDIIGMTPKRLLHAERPIRARDVQRPVVVPKGSVVTIILQMPGMTLTSKGKAMENGSDGETIRVINTKTKRTIDAIVLSSSTVTVVPLTAKHAQLALNQ